MILPSLRENLSLNISAYESTNSGTHGFVNPVQAQLCFALRVCLQVQLSLSKQSNQFNEQMIHLFVFQMILKYNIKGRINRLGLMTYSS